MSPLVQRIFFDERTRGRPHKATVVSMEKLEPQVNKSQLRRTFLKIRHSLPLAEWKRNSDRICAHLVASSLFAQAKTVLAYFSFRQEPDLSPLFAANTRMDAFSKIWGFPRCVNNSLVWHVWTPQDSLQIGVYGISEPHAHAPTIDPARVDLILVPCVACDRQGYRLGYGGGYYDRLLAAPEWADKFTVGIVFDFACVAQLPVAPWDKPLDAICTETGWKYIG